jgi:hypothetical protein
MPWLNIPARDLMKFRWALANRPESGLPYVYHQLDLYNKPETHSNEMIHERDSSNSFTLSYPSSIFSLLDRMDGYGIGDSLY